MENNLEVPTAKDYSVDRNIPEVLAASCQVRRRIQAGEGVKLLNEMRLIVITALRRYGGPLDLLALFDHFKNFVELRNPRETLWSQAHYFLKLRDQMFLSDTDLAG
jgi:hypothetical protein